jgi:hypothetical protein
MFWNKFDPVVLAFRAIFFGLTFIFAMYLNPKAVLDIAYYIMRTIRDYLMGQYPRGMIKYRIMNIILFMGINICSMAAGNQAGKWIYDQSGLVKLFGIPKVTEPQYQFTGTLFLNVMAYGPIMWVIFKQAMDRERALAVHSRTAVMNDKSFNAVLHVNQEMPNAYIDSNHKFAGTKLVENGYGGKMHTFAYVNQNENSNYFWLWLSYALGILLVSWYNGSVLNPNVALGFMISNSTGAGNVYLEFGAVGIVMFIGLVVIAFTSVEYYQQLADSIDLVNLARENWLILQNDKKGPRTLMEMWYDKKQEVADAAELRKSSSRGGRKALEFGQNEDEAEEETLPPSSYEEEEGEEGIEG